MTIVLFVSNVGLSIERFQVRILLLPFSKLWQFLSPHIATVHSAEYSTVDSALNSPKKLCIFMKYKMHVTAWLSLVFLMSRMLLATRAHHEIEEDKVLDKACMQNIAQVGSLTTRCSAQSSDPTQKCH